MHTQRHSLFVGQGITSLGGDLYYPKVDSEEGQAYLQISLLSCWAFTDRHPAPVSVSLQAVSMLIIMAY